MKRRREVLQTGSLVLSLGLAELARGATILNVRIWPAPEYSARHYRIRRRADRQTLVRAQPAAPGRRRGASPEPALKGTGCKVRADDPNIAGSVSASLPQHRAPGGDLAAHSPPGLHALTPLPRTSTAWCWTSTHRYGGPAGGLIAQHTCPLPHCQRAASATPAPPAATDPLGELIARHNPRHRRLPPTTLQNSNNSSIFRGQGPIENKPPGNTRSRRQCARHIH